MVDGGHTLLGKEQKLWAQMSYNLNSLKGGYIGDYIGDYYRRY